MQEYFNYTIAIQTNEGKKLRLINHLLLLMAVAFLLKLGIDYLAWPSYSSNTIFLFFVIICIAVIWLYNLLKNLMGGYRYAFFLAGLAFVFYLPDALLKYVFGGLYLMIGLLSKYVFQPKTVKIDRSGILFSGLPGKFYAWEKFSNVLIKDKVLTIDFANNKLYQKDIDGEISPEITAEFNAFSKDMLSQKAR